MNNFNEPSNINEGNKVQVIENSAKGSRKVANQLKRQAIPPLWRIIGKAQRVFNVQLDKGNEVKLRCINSFIASEMSDTGKFWGEFMSHVERLLDSRKYVSDCNLLGYDAANVAEHIVFLGSARLNKVLTLGVKSVLKNDIMLYKDRFSPKEANEYREKITIFLKGELDLSGTSN